MVFNHPKLPQSVREKLARNYPTPTPIQAAALPHILEGRDVIGQAATGSGKTLAFILAFTRLDTNAKREGLVLVPTRELALQIRDAVGELLPHNAVAVYGGVDLPPQQEAAEDATIIIATPGRLLDLIQRGLELNTRILVLDEVDRMLDMGFLPDVERIIHHLPRERQTLFFSATLTPTVERLAQKLMRKPVHVHVEEDLSERLDMVYIDVERREKPGVLAALIRMDPGKSIVFVNTRRMVDLLVQRLAERGVKALPLHGGMPQSKRERTLAVYKKHGGVLVTTDVAARGLHIENVTHVYNYDVPQDADAFKHRVGRTARAGKKGKAITLLSPEDHQNFQRVLDRHDYEISVMQKPRPVRGSSQRDRPRRDNSRRRSPRRQSVSA